MAIPSQHSSTKHYIANISIARGYDHHFADNELFQYDTAVLERWFRRPGRLIDLGCGTGRHLLPFAQRGFAVVGVDLSEHMLAEASRKLSQAQLPSVLCRGDICDLPIGPPDDTGPCPADSFDYAICMFSTIGLIQGYANRLQFLRDVAKILKPLGQLGLHVHSRGNNVWSYEGWRFLAGNFFRSRLGNAEPGDKILDNYRGIRGMYIHVFSEAEITKLLKEAGFDVLELHPLNRRRTGPLRGKFLRWIRANGFLIRAQKPG